MKGKGLEFLRGLKTEWNENRPAILTGIVVGGVVLTGVLAYKAGLQMKDVLDEYHEDLKDVKDGDKEAVKDVRKKAVMKSAAAVAPVVVVGGLTIASAIESNKESYHKIATLSMAYTAAESSLRDWKEKTKELVGERKAKEVQDEIMKDHLKQTPVTPMSKIVSTGYGEMICKDLYTGVTFRSNIESVNQAIAATSAKCRAEDWVTLYDLYCEFGIPMASIPSVSEDIGWCVDEMDHGTIPVYKSSQLLDEGIPILTFEYDVRPQMLYGKFS